MAKKSEHSTQVISTFPKVISLFIIAWIVYSCSNPKPNVNTPIQKIYTSLPDTSIHFDSTLTRSYNQYWNRLHTATHYSGVTLLYSKGRFYSWCAGMADSAVPLRIHMPMQIASISKTFTATAVMILVQQGKISLQDSLRHFFPKLPYQNITIEQLLSHSSGLPEYTWFTDAIYKDSNRLDNKRLLHLMEDAKPELYYRPGKRHRYTNTNFTLLASIIEKISGLSYPEFLKKHIFIPLGMLNTRVLASNENWNLLEVKGHYGNGAIIDTHYQDGTYGDKNIISTVWDLFLYYKGLRDNKILNAIYRNEMFAVRWPNARRGTGYALGWRLRPSEGETWMFHSGWWHGFRTNFYFNLERDECAIILANRLSGGFIPGQTILAMFDEKNWSSPVHLPHSEKENIFGQDD